MSSRFFSFAFLIFLLPFLGGSGAFLFAQSKRPLGNTGYPEIPLLSSRDVIFRQYQDDVEEASKAFASRKKSLLSFYSYTVREGDTFFSIAARCSLRYDSIASLNGIADSSSLRDGALLVLPVANGVYVAASPVTAVDQLLWRQFASFIFSDSDESEDVADASGAVGGGASEAKGNVPPYKEPVLCFVGGKKYYFIPDGKFSPEVRAFFVNTAMYLPLSQSVLSSEFGMRVSPISGRWIMHHGIDMASPLGSDVFACRSGTVLRVTKMDPVYGNYIILGHEGGMTSLYAHLKDFCVQKGDIVSGGSLIAHVGLTGLTTGPHLHFEIRTNGTAQNPSDYLPR